MIPTLCKVCNKNHWLNQPHIFAADAPLEKRRAKPAEPPKKAKPVKRAKKKKHP